MIQVMTREQAEKRNLFTIDPITGKQVPFTSWRMELTEEQKEAHKKQIESGQVPF